MWKDVVPGKQCMKSPTGKIHLCQKSKVSLRLKGFKAGTITLKIFLMRQILAASGPLPINTSEFPLEELHTCLAKMSKQKPLV